MVVVGDSEGVKYAYSLNGMGGEYNGAGMVDWYWWGVSFLGVSRKKRLKPLLRAKSVQIRIWNADLHAFRRY
jgi:hypothetical protein